MDRVDQLVRSTGSADGDRCFVVIRETPGEACYYYVLYVVGHDGAYRRYAGESFIAQVDGYRLTVGHAGYISLVTTDDRSEYPPDGSFQLEGDYLELQATGGGLRFVPAGVEVDGGLLDDIRKRLASGRRALRREREASVLKDYLDGLLEDVRQLDKPTGHRRTVQWRSLKVLEASLLQARSAISAWPGLSEEAKDSARRVEEAVMELVHQAGLMPRPRKAYPRPRR